MITDYQSLIDAVERRLGNTNLTANVPEYIALVEAELNRVLFAFDSEVTATNITVADDETIALPNQFRQMRSLTLGSDPTNVLTQLSVDDLRAKWGDSASAQPVNYAISSGQIFLGPAPDTTYTATMEYIQGITALTSDNTTNWLIDDHPDIYLAGCLLHAEFEGWNDERLPLIRSQYDEFIAQFKRADAMKRHGSQAGEVAGIYY